MEENYKFRQPPAFCDELETFALSSLGVSACYDRLKDVFTESCHAQSSIKLSDYFALLSNRIAAICN
jgi:hypothetical protein